jgi:GT2 family glycosyltransferase
VARQRDSERSAGVAEASIIVPTLNRAAVLAENIGTWATQDAAVSYDVVVVDNGSQDATENVVRTLMARWPHVRYLREPRIGAAAARHAGAIASSAALLLFLDDDMRAASDMLRSHLQLHRTTRRACGLGRVVWESSVQPFERMLAYIYEGPRSSLEERAPGPMDCWAGHMSVPRGLYEEVGGFDSTLAEGEDLELGIRLEQHGVKFVYLPSAVTMHRFRGRFGPALRRAYQQGEALREIASRHPGSRLPGLSSLPGPRFLHLRQWWWSGLARLLEPFDRGRGVPTALLALAYQESLGSARARGWRHWKRRHDMESAASPRGERHQEP